MTAIERLKVRIPEEENDLVLKEILETATSIILTRLYPFEDDLSNKTVPYKYNTLLCDIATELYNKKGAEGETAHSENGVSRTYSSAYVSPELLSQIIPVAKVFGGDACERSKTQSI